MLAATPQSAVDELLAADRAFSAASAKTDLVSGLTAMFADDVVIPNPPGQWAEGKTAVAAVLRANADNARSRTEWTPLRGGISADGQHGFTAGFMTLHRPDGATLALKYLAYWVKQPDGWRVAAYKRVRAGEGPASSAMLAPALPAQLVPPSTDAAAIARHRDSLDRAERAFSDEAQKIGLGPGVRAVRQRGRAEPRRRERRRARRRRGEHREARAAGSRRPAARCPGRRTGSSSRRAAISA